MNRLSKQLFSIAKQLYRISRKRNAWFSLYNVNGCMALIDRVGSYSLYQINEDCFEEFNALCDYPKTAWCNAHDINFFYKYLPCYLITKNNKPQGLIHLPTKQFKDTSDITYAYGKYNKDIAKLVENLIIDKNFDITQNDIGDFEEFLEWQRIHAQDVDLDQQQQHFLS